MPLPFVIIIYYKLDYNGRLVLAIIKITRGGSKIRNLKNLTELQEFSSNSKVELQL